MLSSRKFFYSVGVALAVDASLSVAVARMTASEAIELDHMLSGLLALGHVAAFVVERTSLSSTTSDLLKLYDRLGDRLGSDLISVARLLPLMGQVRPGHLAQVWAFDHQLEGMPATTACLLGLDLEVLATPSPDEEIGAHLPGRDGLWLIHARPMF